MTPERFYADGQWWVETEVKTLRDYFAAKAMASIIALRHYDIVFQQEQTARLAYAMADEMLKERGRGEDEA